MQVANPNRAQFTKCAGYAIPYTVRNGQEHDIFPPNETKPPKKRTKRRKARSLKSAKRGKQPFLQSTKENSDPIRIPNDDFIAWQLHADMKVYMFDMEEHEDPNMSEEANFDKTSYKEHFKRKADAVAPQNPVERRRDSPKFPMLYSMKEANNELEQTLSALTDSDEDLNGIMFRWVEKLGCVMLGVLLGIVLRHYWTSFLRCLPSDVLSWFRNSKGYKCLDKEEQPRIKVDTSK